MAEPITPTLRGHSTRVMKKSAKDYALEETHQFRVNRNSFTIFVGGDPHDEGDAPDTRGVEPGVTHHMADRFEMNLNFLSSIDPDRPILVYLSSCGGNWDEGMQMFSAILYCPNPVTVIATKWARSMTSLIPLAADRFIMRPPAQYMIHRGTQSFSGLDQEVDTFEKQRLLAHEMMMRIYVGRLREQGALRRSSDVRIREHILRRFEKEIDVWLSADEAVRFGFADGVFDGDHAKLRAPKKDLKRRQYLMEILRKPITIEPPTAK